MVDVMDLWLPILLSAVAVFIASFLAWMVLPHHKPDIKELNDEEGFLASLKSLDIKPGLYFFPWCGDPNKLKDPEFKKVYEAGPHGILNVAKAMPSMPRNLLLVFIFYIVVGVFVAYLGKLGLQRGAEFMDVFRFTGTAAIAAYALGFIPNGIFFGRTFRAMTMDLIDGFVYGAVTGLIFAWLWPALETVAPGGNVPTLPGTGG